jgi:hypothetical protein
MIEKEQRDIKDSKVRLCYGQRVVFVSFDCGEIEKDRI